MEDRALRGALFRRLWQIASEQDPLRLERRALSQHVRRALSESANEHVLPPPGIMDDYGRFSYALIKDAVDWALASPSAPERSSRAVTTHLVNRYLPYRDHGASPDDHSADPEIDDAETDMRRSIDGPRMARDLVTLLTPGVARVISMALEGATYDQISISEGIPIATLHRRVKKAEALISEYVTRFGLGPCSTQHVFRLIARIRDTEFDLCVRDEIRNKLARELESRALAADPAVGRRGESS